MNTHTNTNDNNTMNATNNNNKDMNKIRIEDESLFEAHMLADELEFLQALSEFYEQELEDSTPFDTEETPEGNEEKTREELALEAMATGDFSRISYEETKEIIGDTPKPKRKDLSEDADPQKIVELAEDKFLKHLGGCTVSLYGKNFYVPYGEDMIPNIIHKYKELCSTYRIPADFETLHKRFAEAYRMRNGSCSKVYLTEHRPDRTPVWLLVKMGTPVKG